MEKLPFFKLEQEMVSEFREGSARASIIVLCTEEDVRRMYKSLSNAYILNPRGLPLSRIWKFIIRIKNKDNPEIIHSEFSRSSRTRNLVGLLNPNPNPVKSVQLKLYTTWGGNKPFQLRVNNTFFYICRCWILFALDCFESVLWPWPLHELTCTKGPLPMVLTYWIIMLKFVSSKWFS